VVVVVVTLQLSYGIDEKVAASLSCFSALWLQGIVIVALDKHQDPTSHWTARKQLEQQ